MKDLKSIEFIDEYLYYYRYHTQSVMSHPKGIYTLSVDLQTEAIAVQKIISNYMGFPIVKLYVNKINSWGKRLINAKINPREKKLLLSILQDNFSNLEELYKSEYMALYDSLK